MLSVLQMAEKKRERGNWLAAVAALADGDAKTAVRICQRGQEKNEAVCWTLLSVLTKLGLNQGVQPSQSDYFLNLGMASGDETFKDLRDAKVHPNDLCLAAEKETKNAETRFVLLVYAALQGNAKSELLVGLAYDQGQGVEKNPVLAGKWWTRAADRGDACAMTQLATASRLSGDHDVAFTFAVQAAKAGYKPGQYLLSMIYDDGKGVPEAERAQAPKLRQEWLLEATKSTLEQDACPAALLAWGLELEKNGANEEAFKMTSEAASAFAKNKDDPTLNKSRFMPCLNILGTYYMLGIGTSIDGKRAFELFTQAAVTETCAKFNLALCYAGGIGVKASGDRAEQQFEAVRQTKGFSGGFAFDMATCYDQGLGDLKRDAKMAERLYKDDLNFMLGVRSLCNLGAMALEQRNSKEIERLLPYFDYFNNEKTPLTVRNRQLMIDFEKRTEYRKVLNLSHNKDNDAKTKKLVAERFEDLCNFPEACYNYAVCLHLGYGVNQNQYKSLSKFYSAAQKGYVPAICALVYLNSRTRLMEQDSYFDFITKIPDELLHLTNTDPAFSDLEHDHLPQRILPEWFPRLTKIIDEKKGKQAYSSSSSSNSKAEDGNVAPAQSFLGGLFNFLGEREEDTPEIVSFIERNSSHGVPNPAVPNPAALGGGFSDWIADMKREKEKENAAPTVAKPLVAAHEVASESEAQMLEGAKREGVQIRVLAAFANMASSSQFVEKDDHHPKEDSAKGQRQLEEAQRKAREAKQLADRSILAEKAKVEAAEAARKREEARAASLAALTRAKERELQSVKDRLEKQAAEANAIIFQLASSSSQKVADVPKVQAGESGLCVVCLETPSVCLLLPCRHLCLCKTCRALKQKWDSCPSCRAAVKESIEVFVS